MIIKKAFLLLAIMFNAVCFAQDIKKNTDFGYSKSVKKAHYTNQFNEQIYHYFDKKGRLIKIYSNDREGEHLPLLNDTIYHTVEYIYEKDKLVKRLNFDSDTLKATAEFIYDKGKLVLELYDGKAVQYCYKDNKLASKQEIYNDTFCNEVKTYNDKLNLIETKKSCEDEEVKEIKREYKTEQYYLVETYFPRLYQEEFKVDERRVYYYDKNKNIIRECYNFRDEETCDDYFYRNNILYNSRHYSKGELFLEKFFDSKGHLTQEKSYKGLDDIIYKNTYNTNWDLVQVEFTEYGRLWVKKYEYEYWD